MERFAKIGQRYFANRSTLNVWQDSEYAYKLSLFEFSSPY